MGDGILQSWMPDPRRAVMCGRSSWAFSLELVRCASTVCQHSVLVGYSHQVRLSTRRCAIDTRTRIVKAATEILLEGKGERPSVRAVAARAGIGASTLRHYFPTQRELMSAMLTAMYDESLPDGRIRDTAAPARRRLMESLWSMLDPVSSVTEARAVWDGVFTSFIGPEASEQSRAGYLVLEREALRRVQAWLAILEEEGVLPKGDNPARARFLLTVVDGLSIERALADSGSRIENERATLAFAVDAVLAGAVAD